MPVHRGPHELRPSRIVLDDDVPEDRACRGHCRVGSEHPDLDIRDVGGLERRRRLREARILESLDLREVPDKSVRVGNDNRVGRVETDRARREEQDVQGVLREVVLRRVRRHLVEVRPHLRIRGGVELEPVCVDVVPVDEFNECKALTRRGRAHLRHRLVATIDDGLRQGPAEGVVQREAVRVKRVLKVQAPDDDHDLLVAFERPRLLCSVFELVPLGRVEDVVSLAAVPPQVRGAPRSIAAASAPASRGAGYHADDHPRLGRVALLVGRVEQDDRGVPAQGWVGRLHAREPAEREDPVPRRTVGVHAGVRHLLRLGARIARPIPGGERRIHGIHVQVAIRVGHPREDEEPEARLDRVDRGRRIEPVRPLVDEHGRTRSGRGSQRGGP